jgi:hypothetical protein
MIGLVRIGVRMSPKQRPAVREIGSVPLLSDLSNWILELAQNVECCAKTKPIWEERSCALLSS